jgi:hypothetical protein
VFGIKQENGGERLRKAQVLSWDEKKKRYRWKQMPIAEAILEEEP